MLYQIHKITIFLLIIFYVSFANGQAKEIQNIEEIPVLFRGHKNNVKIHAYNERINYVANARISESSDSLYTDSGYVYFDYYVIEPGAGKYVEFFNVDEMLLDSHLVLKIPVKNLPLPELYLGDLKSSESYSKERFKVQNKLFVKFPIESYLNDQLPINSWSLHLGDSLITDGLGDNLNDEALLFLQNLNPKDEIKFSANVRFKSNASRRMHAIYYIEED